MMLEYYAGPSETAVALNSIAKAFFLSLITFWRTVKAFISVPSLLNRLPMRD